ncbi:MAG TPA: hypothetical protein VF759_04085 [Allosphingosinicella sp.]|jgi:hypothetical protein
MKRVAALLALLSACGGPPAARPDNLVECAVDGAADFARVCTLERARGGSGVVLTIRSPSGSFRRLVTTGDGRGVMAADGAEEASVAIAGENLIEVAIGSDRYRLPARLR